MPPTKIAIITGACSGIGLHTVHHLLAKKDISWHIILADINTTAWETIRPTLDPSRTSFHPTNVSSWEDNAALFSSTISSHGRIDFFFANAGCGDRESLLQPFDLSAPPQKPDLTCFDVQLSGTFYQLKLFVYYSRLVREEQPDFSSRFVITSSMTAQYPFPVAPQYAAGKAALLSLTRSLVWLAGEGVYVNCIMPGYVKTGITPKGLNEAWPEKWVTGVETIARAVDELIDERGEVVRDGLSDGKDGVKVGQAVEAVIDRLYYREPVEYCHESEKFVIDEAMTDDGIWMRHVKKASSS